MPYELQSWGPPNSTSQRQLAKTVVTLPAAEGTTRQAELVTRTEAERLINELDVGELALMAHEEAFPSGVCNIIGQATLNLETGETWPSGYIEGDAESYADDAHLLPLYEYNAESTGSQNYDYTHLHLLSESEANELERELRRERPAGAGEDFNLRWRVGADGVDRYLRRKGDTVERRKEEAVAQAAQATLWPNWDLIRPKLDEIYGRSDPISR